MYFPWSKLIWQTNKVLQYNVPTWKINIAMKSSLKWEGERANYLGNFCRGNPHNHNSDEHKQPSFISPTHFYIYMYSKVSKKESDRAWNTHSNEVGFVTNEKNDRVKGYKYCDQEVYLYSHLTHKRLCCSLARYLFKAAIWGK